MVRRALSAVNSTRLMSGDGVAGRIVKASQTGTILSAMVHCLKMCMRMTTDKNVGGGGR